MVMRMVDGRCVGSVSISGLDAIFLETEGSGEGFYTCGEIGLEEERYGDTSVLKMCSKQLAYMHFLR